MKRLKVLATAVATLIVATNPGVGATAPASPGSSKVSLRAGAPMPMKVINYNTDRKWEAWTAFVSTMQSQSGPAFGMAQEVCRGRFMDTYAQMSGSWTMGFRYREVGYNGKCPEDFGRGDAGIGEVIIYNAVPATWPGVSFNPTPYNYPVNFDPPFNNFGLSCIQTPWYNRTVVACSTHLPTGFQGTIAQRTEVTRQIKNMAATWTNQGKLVVIAGDFNSIPSNTVVDNLYPPTHNGSGNMRDVHQIQCGCRSDTQRPTTTDGKKLDYVWWSRGDVSSSPAVSVQELTGSSGHKLIDARVNVYSTP